MDEQNNTNDTNESSNSSMLSRSAQMIQAASPYLDESTKKTLESIVHVTDFLETMQTFRQKGFSSMFSGLLGGRQKKGDTVSMANLNSGAAALDTESILRSIRPFCTTNEGSLIDRILNMLSMQKMFKMYQTMQSMMSMMNMTNDNAKQNSDTPPPAQEPSYENNDMNSYYDTYWNSFQTNNENVNAYDDGNTNENSEFSYYTDGNTSTNTKDSNFDFNQTSDNYNQETNNYGYNQGFNQGFNQDFNNMFNQDTNNYNYNQGTNNFNYNPNGSNYDFNQDYNQSFNQDNNNNGFNSTSTNNNSNTTTNTQMLDMLSSLIPPEQKNTFDAMKLLFESGMLK